MLRFGAADLGYSVFEIRHPDGNWADPKTVEKSVTVNFWGYLALKDAKAIAVLEKELKKDTLF